MTTTDVLEALAALGFSEIEGRVYSFLLAGSPATGYKISHAIGKPTANTYKAIAALEAKGAILVDEGENRLCRAVPPRELMAQLERGYRSSCSQAETLLSELHEDELDNRIYQIKSVDQVLERARQMLAGARRIVLADLFPRSFEVLAGDLEAAARRGVEVAAKTYTAEEIEGARIVYDLDKAHALEEWPGQQLSLVVDGEEHLLALLTPDLDGVRQAVWSQSLFLSCMHHNHVATEIMLTAARKRPSEQGAEFEELGRITVLRSNPPGMEKLKALYGTN